MEYKLYFNVATSVATIKPAPGSSTAGSILLGTFVDDAPGLHDTDGQVFFHHVRDALYPAGYTDMSLVQILLKQPPLFATNPAITGTVNVGEVLTCTPGTHTGLLPMTVAYKWFYRNTAGGANLAPAGHIDDAATFTPQAALQGKYLVCEVTLTNADGTLKKVTTAAGPVVAV